MIERISKCKHADGAQAGASKNAPRRRGYSGKSLRARFRSGRTATELRLSQPFPLPPPTPRARTALWAVQLGLSSSQTRILCHWNCSEREDSIAVPPTTVTMSTSVGVNVRFCPLKPANYTFANEMKLSEASEMELRTDGMNTRSSDGPRWLQASSTASTIRCRYQRANGCRRSSTIISTRSL